MKNADRLQKSWTWGNKRQSDANKI